jgi:peptidoglycan/LPS O-acetylase OafA/YrhL
VKAASDAERAAFVPRDREAARVPALDGLRGFAILLVLAFHYAAFLPRDGWWSYLQLIAGTAWVGVDLFFVLSGFLITGILLDARATPRYYRNFYIRRALRIFPLYYVCVSLLLLLRVTWPAARELLGDGSLWPASTYTQNVVMSLPGGLELVPRATYHFWSLAIEEQFYLFWPFFISKLKAGRLTIACVVIMVACLILRGILWHAEVDSRALYFLTPTRLDVFAAGAFVSAAYRSPALWERVSRLAPVVAVAGIAYVLLLFALHGYNPMFTEGASGWLVTLDFTLLAISFAAIVAWCARPGIASRVAAARGLRFFGHYSYAIYLFHPVAGLVSWSVAQQHLAPTGVSPVLLGLAIVGSATVVTVTAARLSWVVVETPFLRLKGRFPSGRARLPRAIGPLTPHAGAALEAKVGHESA